MIGIYKYENLLNGHIYIGQSNFIEKRKVQHLYDARHRPARSCSIDQAIAKYGIENFSFEIIEECSIDELDDREIYWINYYDSYTNGYNNTRGGISLKGEDHPRALLSEEQVWEIRELYNQHVSRKIVFAEYVSEGISERGLKHIWDGDNWPTVHMDVYTEENKQWHKNNVGHAEDQVGKSSLDRAYSQDEIDNFVKDYQNGMTYCAIAKKYNRDPGNVKKYIEHPVANEQVLYKGRKIKNINTGIEFSSISQAAKWAKCGATTLTRHLAGDKKAGTVPDTCEIAEWEEIT